MNLQQLEYIVALDAHKNFSKAAEACFITQATLSTMVKKLEEELDLIIFDRKTLPILTTDCGKKIIEEAKQVLLHTKQLKIISSEIKDIVEGELRIGIIPTIASSLLHRILPELFKKYPQLKLSIQEITTANILKQLKTGELDVGILSTPLKTNEFESSLLYYEKLLVYGKSTISSIKYLHPKDLVNESIWLLEEGNCLTDQIVNLCTLNKKAINSNLNFNPNSIETLINMVDHLKGLTLIPELFYQDLPEDRKLKVKAFDSPYPVREVSLVFNRPYAKLRLLEALKTEIKALVIPMLQTGQLQEHEMNIVRL